MKKVVIVVVISLFSFKQIIAMKKDIVTQKKMIEFNFASRENFLAISKAISKEKLSKKEVQVIIEKNKQGIGCRTNFDEPLLNCALHKDKNDFFNFLLKYCADPKEENSAGFNALIVAAAYNNIKALELLIKKKIDINHANSYKETALHRAIINGCFEAVSLLIFHDAKINAIHGIFKKDSLDLAKKCLYEEKNKDKKKDRVEILKILKNFNKEEKMK